MNSIKLSGTHQKYIYIKYFWEVEHKNWSEKRKREQILLHGSLWYSYELYAPMHFWTSDISFNND